MASNITAKNLYKNTISPFISAQIKMTSYQIWIMVQSIKTSTSLVAPPSPPWWLGIIFAAQVFFINHHGFSIWAAATTDHTRWNTCHPFSRTTTPHSLTLIDSFFTLVAYTNHEFIRCNQSTQHFGLQLATDVQFSTFPNSTQHANIHMFPCY